MKIEEEEINNKEEKKASTKKAGFVFETEENRLLRDVSRPDMEKFLLFTQMIRRNKTMQRFGVK